jgi:hypothetical protein
MGGTGDVSVPAGVQIHVLFNLPRVGDSIPVERIISIAVRGQITSKFDFATTVICARR